MTAFAPGITSLELDAARTLLARMGITPSDLLDVRPPAPTFAEYIPTVRARVESPSTLRTFNTHWKRVEREWGTRRIDEPTTAEITEMRDEARRNAKTDRNARDGRGAAEAMIGALRFLYKHADNDGFLRPGDNPAKRVGCSSFVGTVDHAASW